VAAEVITETARTQGGQRLCTTRWGFGVDLSGGRAALCPPYAPAPALLLT